MLQPDTPLDEAAKCALISMDSTLRSNISVGLPLDLLVYDTGALRVTHFASIDEHNEYFRMIRGTWGERLRQVFAEIPDPLWTNPESPDSWCPPAACTSPSGSTPWTCRRKATRRRRCWPRAGVGSVELETAHVRLYAIPGCPTLRPTHVNFTCPPSEARMQAIAAGFRVLAPTLAALLSLARLRSAMKTGMRRLSSCIACPNDQRDSSRQIAIGASAWLSV